MSASEGVQIDPKDLKSVRQLKKQRSKECGSGYGPP